MDAKRIHGDPLGGPLRQESLWGSETPRIEETATGEGRTKGPRFHCDACHQSGFHGNIPAEECRSDWCLLAETIKHDKGSPIWALVQS